MPQTKNHIAILLFVALLTMLSVPVQAQVHQLPDGQSRATSHAPTTWTTTQPGVSCWSGGLAGTTSLYTVSIKVTGDKGYAVHENDTIPTGQSKEYKVPDGASFTVDAFPDEGYRVDQLRYKVGSHSTDIEEFTDRTSVPRSTTYDGVKEDIAYEVRFEKIPDTIPTYDAIILVADSNGYIEYNGKKIMYDHLAIEPLAEGDTGTVTVYPKPGYRVARLKHEYYYFLADNTYYYDDATTPHTFKWKQLKRDIWIEAFFEPVPAVRPSYKVKVTSHPHGYTEVRGDMLRDGTKNYDVLEGDSLLITAYPDDDHRVNEFRTERLGSGVVEHFQYTDQVTVPQTLTYDPVKKDATVDVYFEKLPGTLRTYTLTVQSRGRGRTLANGITVRDTTLEVPVEEESMVSLHLTPDQGYRLARYILQFDGSDPEVTTFSDNTSTQHDATIPDITHDATLTVTYEPLAQTETPYLLIQQGDEGSIDIQLPATGTTRATATADTGWTLHSASLDGRDITAQLADSAYLLPDLTDNALLYVVYEQTDPAAILSPEVSAVQVHARQGGVTISNVPVGTAVSLWTIDGRQVSRQKATAPSIDIPLSTGVYLLRVAGRTFKFNIIQ